jgi:uncharacterized cupredoxin-like copper-binding protein
MTSKADRRKAEQRRQHERATRSAPAPKVAEASRLAPDEQPHRRRTFGLAPAAFGGAVVLLAVAIVGVVVLASGARGEKGRAEPATTTLARVATTVGHSATTLVPTVELRYSGKEYVFAGPTTAAAAVTRFVLTNDGKEAHNLIVARIGDLVATPTDIEQLKDMFFETSVGKRGSPVVVGSLHEVAPGQEQSVVVDLKPGRYIVACDVANNHATFHYGDGMISLLTVSPSG